MLTDVGTDRRPDEPTPLRSGGWSWRSALEGADPAWVAREASALELTITTLTAEMNRLGERSRGATLALATLLGALAAEIRAIGDQLSGIERVRRLESMRGELQSRLEQLGATVTSDGQVLAFPAADPSLVGELTRLMAELSSALAQLRALIVRLRSAL